MKITIKTLGGKQLPIEVELEWSILQVKEQIEKDHGLKADRLKLIAYGKVLDSDEKKVSDYSLKENDFIVAMESKPKPAPKPKKEEPKKEEDAKKEEPKPATATQPSPSNPPAQQTTTQAAQP